VAETCAIAHSFQQWLAKAWLKASCGASIMARQDQLTPPEQFLLLDPDGAAPNELLKIGFLALATQGIIQISAGRPTGFFGRKPAAQFDLVPGRSLEAGPALSPLVDTIRKAKSGATAAVATQARRDFGPDLAGYRKRLQEDLARRGLLETVVTPRLVVFTRTTYQATAAGQVARAKIRQTIERARDLPELMQTDRTQAAALILAAGGTLLLVDELRPHYQRMGQIARETGDASSGDFSSASDTGSTFNGAGLSDFDPSSLSGLDSAMSSFDASFDASFSGDGGGGDSGGGDSGGGGGD
jgi:hypothetical protein